MVVKIASPATATGDSRVHCTRCVAAKQLGLEPVDYHVWDLIQERVYKTAVRDTTDLKQRLIETWFCIPQTVIDEAIDEWGLRLRACVKSKGRHFEHSL